MEYIKATATLRQSRLYKEYKKLTHQYYLHSIKQEENTKNYLKYKAVKNIKTNQVHKLSYDFETAQRKAKNETLQKIIHIEKLAKDSGLKPLFLTFTLPSKYHPFISTGTNKENRIYIDINKNFLYRTIDNAIQAGYQQLNYLFRAFYRQIKRYENGNLIKYIKVYEPHSSLQVHLHTLFFIHPDDMSKIILYFQKFIKKYDIGKTDFQTNIVSNINKVGSYISKYIYKNATNDNDKYFVRFLDGWKKVNKIRMVSTSQVNINMFLYKKLYTSLPKELKKEMLSISSYNKETLLTTLLKRTEFNEHLVRDDGKSLGTKKRVNNKSEFIIKYEKHIKKKNIQKTKKFREYVYRTYTEETIDSADGFMEEELYFDPYLTDECKNYYGYITQEKKYKQEENIVSLKNIRIYHKNKLLYSQNNYFFITISDKQ